MQFPVETESNTAFDRMGAKAASMTLANCNVARKRGRIGGRRPKLRPNQQDEIVAMVSKGTKTAADAPRLFNVHPATVSRLLANAGTATVGVKV
jgi:DNA invertase Pin-like site-specific DNA recombinase